MLRLAVWSGPRNLSTALMRSWENRPDCAVVDEPLYAHYLNSTRRPHPGFDEILSSQSRDWRAVTRWLCEGQIEGASVWYQKHMTHHLLPSMGRQWLAGLTHCMLVRDPRLVLSSYARAREEITAEDLGFLQQRDLFDHLIEVSGVPPMVVWSQDILERPRATLCAMCAALRVPFYEEMLSWPPGPRPSDGVWAKHWYASVERSTGFAPYVAKAPDYPPHHQDIVDLAMPIFERLLTYRLEPAGPIENCH